MAPGFRYPSSNGAEDLAISCKVVARFRDVIASSRLLTNSAGRVMRVVRTEGSDRDDWRPRLSTHRGQPYAILSHRWLADPNHEVLFSDIDEIDTAVSNTPNGPQIIVLQNPLYRSSPVQSKPAFEKLRRAACQALQDKLDFLWIDTCCIDKSSSAELSEAINSMFAWYKNAQVCYTYLADVGEAAGQQTVQFTLSDWWRRGWTLQELLAPRKLVFFNMRWEIVGDRTHMSSTIAEITGIDENVVNGTLPPQNASIAQRMSWMSQRSTTRIEDNAYCLLGIFDVNMPLLYGEGEKAFLRLQEEVIKHSDDETIFAWKDESLRPSTFHGLLASRPAAFASCGRIVMYPYAEPRIPYQMTQRGMSITLPLRSSDENLHLNIGTLHCVDWRSNDSHVEIFLQKLSGSQDFARVRCREFAPSSRELDPKSAAQGIFIKHTFEQLPIFAPLERSSRQIRLIQILPYEEPNDLMLRLIEADVHTARYTAVSYHWDNSEDTKPTIRVNNNDFQVSPTLHRFMCLASKHLRGKLLWIDALCINQTDAIDKDAQIRLMASIYKNATSICMWLGPTGVCLAELQAVNEEWESDSAERTFRTLSAIQGLARLSNSRYWWRRWLIQELLLCTTISIMLEDGVSPLHSLCELYQRAEVVLNSYRSWFLKYVDEEYIAQLQEFSATLQALC